MTQMNFSIKQRQTHRHREQICGYRVVRGAGRWEKEMGER